MKDLLKKYFGYDEFREGQLEIINNVLDKKDTLVLMPTGGGKSICYQIPALKFKGLTIVISPLISLMKDQVDALQLNGIKAEYINSTLSPNEIKDIENRIRSKKVKLLYVAPERLALKDFKLFLQEIDISLIAVDEAHCISEWGHDFRKEYANLKYLKKTFVSVPIIALTATATSKVKDDILKQLNLFEPKVFVSSFDRENLNLIIRDKKNSFAQILALVEKNKDEPIIIYCHSRKDTKTLVDGLKKYGFKAVQYHAGLSAKVRENNQEMFIKDRVNIVVATIAFGMGIDKSNVRLVIHNTFSKSVESYYQEIGRAGRDGLSSDCILFYSQGDKRKHDFFINLISNASTRKSSSIKLNEMIDYCEGSVCRRKYLLEYFGQEYNEINCGSCDVCLGLPSVSKDVASVKEFKKRVSYDKELFDELKVLRKSIGFEKDISLSNIFSDVTLREIAKVYPRTESEFVKVAGVTEQKLKDFGEDFLILINEYVEINEIAIRMRESEIKEKPVKKKVTKKKYTKKYSKKTTKKYSKTKYAKKKTVKKVTKKKVIKKKIGK